MSATARERGESFLDEQAERLLNLPPTHRRREECATLSNPVAESAVIAGLVNCGDPAEIGRYALNHRLDLECFTNPPIRRAYSAITDLAAAGQPVDVPILAQRLAPEDLAAVDSACREHVSAANFGVYARLLTECKRNRKEAAARDRLAQAAAAGVPDHELLAIVESIRQASAGDSRECRLTEISSLCDLPPSENWLIKRYLPADSLSVMFGSPGCGKSFLAIDLACHVATGRDWRGQPVKPGRVVYIAGEGKNGLSKRFRAWFDRHGEQPRNISLLFTPIALTDPTSVAALVADIRHLPEAPALVVIDTLNRNFGPGDENSTADMTRAVAGLDAIRTATGAAILGVHHSGHLEKGRGRGSSVLLGAVDAEYAVALLGNTVQIRSTKIKDADPPPPLSWTLEKQPLPWADDEGAPLDSAVLVPSKITMDLTPSVRLSNTQRIALDALRSALMAHGTEDKGVVTVSEDEWRKAAYDAGIAPSDTTQQAKRKAFLRARLDLVSSGKVSTNDGRYWIPAPSGTRRYKTLDQSTETGNRAAPEHGFSPTDSHLPPIEGGTKRYKAVHVPLCTARQDGSEAVQGGTHPYRGVPHVPPAGTPYMDAVEKQETQQPAPTLAKTQPITRAQAQEINRQRVKESLAGMVELPGGGWIIPAAPAEPPPAPVDSTPTPPDNPDKTPDIPSTTPAETQSATDTWADKTPDIARDNPQPPADDPLATRVAQLIASGWAPSNAQARARSEALQTSKLGVAS